MREFGQTLTDGKDFDPSVDPRLSAMESKGVAFDQFVLSYRNLPVQDAVPVNGATITSDGSQVLALLNASLIAAATVVFPLSPANGQTFVITAKSAVTTLTLNGNAKSIIGTVTTLGMGGFAAWVFSATAGAWLRMG